MSDALSMLEPAGDEAIAAPPFPSSLGLYARLVLGTLAGMRHGSLRVSLPDGTTHRFGSKAPGAEPAATLRVVDFVFFKKCVLSGDIGLGESYVDGDWETDSVTQLIAFFIRNIDNTPGLSGSAMRNGGLNVLRFANRLQHLLRPNSVTTSRRNIAEHYDLGNDFYRLWLDETMTYSSAIFTAPGQPLADAQREKYDRLCRLLRLTPGDHVLEIGCGWGGFAEHAAKNYGARVTGVTISKAQHDFAVERMRRNGIADRVRILQQDYRELTGQFDKVVSIEMMEALGDRYLGVFCQQLHRLLKPHGLAALHFITVPDSRHACLRRGVDFIQKHIFPGSLLLSVSRVNEALHRAGDLLLHDMADFGHSYARTLRCWRETFAQQTEAVRALGFDTCFMRKWAYYLEYCEAAFATRNISVIQALYTRPNNPALGENFSR